MQFSLLFLTAVTASVIGAHEDCPTQRLDNHILKRAVAYESDQRHGLLTRDSSNLELKVYFHNVATGPIYDEAYVSDRLLQEQFAVIHERFLTYGIHMNLGGITHTINPSWSNVTANSLNEAEMKTALHKGTYADINIYVVKSVYYPDRSSDTSTSINLTDIEVVPVKGYAYFPVAGYTFLSDVFLDGVVITYQAVTGSNATGRDLGVSVVHEIGHWFGLEHTYARGCEGLGDGIVDTPNEDLSALTGSNNICPTGRDTCPGQEGLDPVHNYMDTTTDACRTEFSPGQVERMFALFNLLRLPKVPS